MVDARREADFRAQNCINGKFTPNPLIRIFSEFSAGLPQRKHSRFIDRC
jgi:hypothetical protein